MANVITRRSFLKAGAQASIAAGLASVANIPLFLQKALAEGNIGLSGKKLLFIFLRGGNDGVNNIIPIQDPSYAPNRLSIGIPKDPAVFYDVATGQCDNPGVLQPYAIRLGNGFAAMNPNLFNLAPVFNAGKLALIHRAAYTRQSRSHFDSEIYWEKATDGISSHYRTASDGIFYRTIVESGWNQNHALSGVSIQSNLPQSLRGVHPMTNLSSINRYNLLGVAGSVSGGVSADRVKLLNAIDAANGRPMATKDNRQLVTGLGNSFRDTLDTFQDDSFEGNEIYDTNGATHLFPLDQNTNQAGVDGNSYGFFQNLKSAAQVLASTDAIIAGTEMGGFDTHTGQVTNGSPHLGGHARLLKRIGWAIYALSKFFSNSSYSPRVRWEDVVVITMSEFGRTSAENASDGTDHAEASVIYVAGGSVNGGVFGCDTNPHPKLGGPNWAPGTGVKDGALFSANTSVGYLKRTIDYRSVLGEIIRDHLGATQAQLNRIIPAYLTESVDHLKDGGTVIYPNASSTPIIGELGIV